MSPPLDPPSVPSEHGCSHKARIRPVTPAADHCPVCAAAGTSWDELWLCLSCGWVSCSNDSPGRHAEAHYAETDHPIAAPLGGPPGTRWCFVHQRHI
jgi:uncharacterized UBP type Zn finger protein